MAARSRQPAEDDVDISIGEAELAKLQNQYRILEGVRKQESEDSQNEIRKQVMYSSHGTYIVDYVIIDWNVND